MTTYINTTTTSTVKDLLAAAVKAGYRFNNIKAMCPLCTIARYSALKLNKGRDVLYACPCGYRRKVVQDGNNSVIDKRGTTTAATTIAVMGNPPKVTKPKAVKSKAKEMINPKFQACDM